MQLGDAVNCLAEAKNSLSLEENLPKKLKGTCRQPATRLTSSELEYSAGWISSSSARTLTPWLCLCKGHLCRLVTTVSVTMCSVNRGKRVEKSQTRD